MDAVFVPVFRTAVRLRRNDEWEINQSLLNCISIDESLDEWRTHQRFASIDNSAPHRRFIMALLI